MNTTEWQDKVIPIEIQDEVLIPIETKFIPIGTKKKFSEKTSKTNLS